MTCAAIFRRTLTVEAHCRVNRSRTAARSGSDRCLAVQPSWGKRPLDRRLCVARFHGLCPFQKLQPAGIGGRERHAARHRRKSAIRITAFRCQTRGGICNLRAANVSLCKRRALRAGKGIEVPCSQRHCASKFRAQMLDFLVPRELDAEFGQRIQLLASRRLVAGLQVNLGQG